MLAGLSFIIDQILYQRDNYQNNYRPLHISLSSSFKRFDKFSFFVVVLACNKIEKQLTRWNVSEHFSFDLAKSKIVKEQKIVRLTVIRKTSNVDS